MKKKCVKCQKEKLLTEFSFRTTEQRYEARCKECRRVSVPKKETQKIAQACVIKSKSVVPNRIIEPTARMTNEVLESINKLSEQEDLVLPQSQAERFDIIQRFNEFVGLLLEGYGEKVGKNVYLQKSK